MQIFEFHVSSALEMTYVLRAAYQLCYLYNFESPIPLITLLNGNKQKKQNQCKL